MRCEGGTYDNDMEQQMLSSYLKDVHLSLRNTATKIGAEKAWQEHCKDQDTLTKYATFMQKLATEHWMGNNEGPSRISWAANFCDNYFNNKCYTSYSDKEQVIATKMGLVIENKDKFHKRITLLDVGSCYNPFKEYDTILNVTAIDLCPANDTVFKCDILEVPIGETTIVKDNYVTQFEGKSFEAVVFSFLLEYIPSSDLRIAACNKAYSLLKYGGLLLICTPDSKHVGANAKLMKCWRYTLAQLGFSRIQYIKYKYIHCMAFRKSLHTNIAYRWALLHKESYMKHAIHIPQDFNTSSNENEDKVQHESISSLADFEEMPFYDVSI